MKSILYFDKSERNALIVIIIIITSRIILPYIVISNNSLEIKFSSQIIETSYSKSTISLKNNAQNQIQSSQKKINQNEETKKVKTKRHIKLFRFNPNNASKKDLISLGFSKKTSQTIINYRKKGGKFYSINDLNKIYGMDSIHLNKISLYIDFLQKKSYKSESINQKPFPKNHSKRLDFVIEINNGTEEDFMKINGIGPAFSKRIIKYRKLLGGFVAINQLSEVYGIKDSLINKNINHFIIDTLNITKIEINKINLEDLRKHPYLDYKTAKIIYNYRNNHYPLSNKSSILKIKGVPNEKLKKILPYLTFKVDNKKPQPKQDLG